MSRERKVWLFGVWGVSAVFGILTPIGWLLNHLFLHDVPWWALWAVGGIASAYAGLGVGLIAAVSYKLGAAIVDVIEPAPKEPSGKIGRGPKPA